MPDSLLLFPILLFFGFVIYYLLFRAPETDLLFSSESDNDIYSAQAFLEESGIKTYIKSQGQYRLKYYGGLANASLHVVDPSDRDRALRILESRK
jgi:hypothetical protein